MKNKFQHVLLLIVGVCIIPILNSCGIYSFTGASTNAKTISIQLFTSKAQNAPIKASQLFTEALKTKFTTEGNLKLLNTDGDLQFSGYISSYSLQSKAPQAGQTSGLVQITLSVHVDFMNKLDEKDKWNLDFSRYAVYDATQNLSTIEDAKLTEINNQLVEDIFNKALVKW